VQGPASLATCCGLLLPNTHAYRLLIFKERLLIQRLGHSVVSDCCDFVFVCRDQRRPQLWHRFDSLRKPFGEVFQLSASNSLGMVATGLVWARSRGARILPQAGRCAL
ncbi:hypothetical protein, partial [Aquabacterium commune]|uniref:hypothetical protein n=1 Tax=Aquabacterium commune TaxID=70586 RepID=UPI001AAD2785